MKEHSATGVDEIITAIQAYTDTTTQQKWLVSPATRISSQAIPHDSAVEVRCLHLIFVLLQVWPRILQLLEILLSTLKTLNQSDFKDTANCVPQPYTLSPDDEAVTSKPYNLPSVLVPPEVIELDSMSPDSGEESPIKKEEWPEFFVRLFPDDVCISLKFSLQPYSLILW